MVAMVAAMAAMVAMAAAMAAAPCALALAKAPAIVAGKGRPETVVVFFLLSFCSYLILLLLFCFFLFVDRTTQNVRLCNSAATNAMCFTAASNDLKRTPRS